MPVSYPTFTWKATTFKKSKGALSQDPVHAFAQAAYPEVLQISMNDKQYMTH